MPLEISSAQAKPFLKWAGGKSKLIPQFVDYFPQQLKLGKINRYVEPFIGGGSVLFYIAQNYLIEEFVIADISPEIVMAYQVIKNDVESLINSLLEIQAKYFTLEVDQQKELFYDIRSKFNLHQQDINLNEINQACVERTAYLIFLNRTCFNGLYRVNSKSEFNVPFGRYKNPKICSTDNLRAVSAILQDAEIRHGDFMSCEDVVDNKTFVYFDPPYRPISVTANFNSYSNLEFDDAAQIRLADFFRKLDARGAKLMLSNSDPKNINPDDDFFEKAYQGYKIERVKASRMINSNAQKRGQINELIIMNY
ncbi:DNA adenine methylase [Crinalium epipsammum PCC 9333]|uniref:Site-specific DNA-methyltransferase (adenine-specific) n=1 Tax=Crinalium epipsammum PCC 9333 TaxID=1173022 RepID=K9W2P4_9CYAN|nr:DNA adenine methylase [Crinalium epipsammum]AFZ14059.1 DNA adenine methylase [Crinalium epipsammum PCC 9333]